MQNFRALGFRPRPPKQLPHCEFLPAHLPQVVLIPSIKPISSSIFLRIFILLCELVFLKTAELQHAVIIITFLSSSCLGQEMAKETLLLRYSSQPGTCPAPEVDLGKGGPGA